MFQLLITALFILLNGFFVAAEFAFVKVRAAQLMPRAKRGDRAAIAAQGVLQRLDRYLSVTQFGITLASLGIGWVGEPALEHLILGEVARSGWSVPEDERAPLRVVVTAVAFTTLTFSHVLVGELVPKLFGMGRPVQVSLLSSLPLRFLNTLFWPLLWVLDQSSKVILRLMGMPPGSTSEGALSAEEIVGILGASATLGPAGKEAGQLVERVVRFAHRTARTAMVPRVDVITIPLETSGADALAAVRSHQFSRLILTKGRNLDDVAGYLYTKDLLFHPAGERLPNVSALRRDVLFVPESQSLLQVMRDMQKENTPIAVVVDEYGGTSGIVTLEDILEEIVGDIRDEFDEEPAMVLPIVGETGAWEVDGRALMEELKNLGLTVEDAEVTEAVGAVVLERLGRLARVGDKVSLGPDASAEVTALHKRRVARVRVRKVTPPPRGTTPPPPDTSSS